MFSYVQKQEGRSIRKDNSLTWKSHIHEFGRRHYSMRHERLKKDNKRVKYQDLLGYNMER